MSSILKLKPGSKGAATYERMIQGAIRAIGEMGLENVSADKLADEAGVAKPLLFHYFEDMEELKLKAIEACNLSGRTFIAEEISKSDCDFAEAYIRANFKWAKKFPAELATLYSGIQRSSYHPPTRKVIYELFRFAWERIGNETGNPTKGRALHSLVLAYLQLANVKFKSHTTDEYCEECIFAAKALFRD